MNKIRHLATTIIASIALTVLCITSCKSYVHENQTEDENCIYISIADDLKENAYRTASVIKPQTDYTVIAYKTDEKGNKLTGEQAASAKELEPFEGIELTYKLALKTGYWVFEVFGYEHKDDVPKDDEGNPIRTNPIFYGNTTKPVFCNGGRYYETIYVYFTAEKTGSVNLDIDVSKVTINKLKISGTGNNVLDGEYSRNDKGKINIKKENLESGTYTAKLDFYTGTALLYSAKETINIKDNLVTENWIYSGGNEYLTLQKSTESEGETNKFSTADFILTPELITKNANAYCYVQGSNATNPYAIKAAKAPADTNTGSAAAPFATLQAAFDRTMALNTEFKNAGKPQHNFTIYINGTVDTSAAKTTSEAGQQVPKQAEISSASSFQLTMEKVGANATPGINGNISIGQNVPTTITSLSMDGIKSLSKLTLNSCTLSGKGTLEINDATEESLIKDTKIGSGDTDSTSGISSLISFKNTKAKILNNRNSPVYATDFINENSILNVSCNSSSQNDKFNINAENFLIKNSGSSGKEITVSGATIHTTGSFSLENCNYLNLNNLTINVYNFATSDLQNTKVQNSQISATEYAINDSDMDFATSSFSGPVSINGNTTGTSITKKITFAGKSSSALATISGGSFDVRNCAVELNENSSIGSTGALNFVNSKLSVNNSSIQSNTATVTIESSNTSLNKATVNVKALNTGIKTSAGSAKTDSVSIANSALETSDGITFNSSTVSITDSTAKGRMFVSNDDLIFNNTVITGDIGKAAGNGSDNDGIGIDTASKIILAGTSTVSGTVYLEDKAMLYVKNLPEKSASQTGIAKLGALYPTKGETVLVNLDNNDNEIGFDNTFVVNDNEIDERFELVSAGFYLTYEVPQNDTIRKGIIKESSVTLILPETGGFTIDIETNNNVKLNSQGYIEINKDKLAQSPIKAVIKDRNGTAISTEITYQLYRESNKIGDAVTSKASANGITIPADNIEQEMKYTDKLTYLLQIIFKDENTKLDYYDIYVVNIVKD